jgi:predicted ATPase
LSLWVLGYPDQALQRSHEALSLAQDAHPFLLTLTLNNAAAFHLWRKEGQRAQERAEQCIALSMEHGFAFYLAAGTSQRGEALARQGQGEEGIALMSQSLTAMQATGTEVARSNDLGVLAEAYGEVGRAEEGLSLLAEALTHVDKTGERVYEAELYRLKGELSLQSRQVKTSQDKSTVRSPESEAEECFLQAIEIAQRQQAKSLELRAVMSLSRLWQQQGKKEEARQMLAEIYGWFTEGFDTADLKETKALLDELS